MALERFGLIKTTLLDYPGEVGAALFTPGCNLRCPYCHNPQLVLSPFPDDLISREDVMAHLKKRAGVLTAVCITGGEPLLHDDLSELITLCKQLGYKVKIDTNGTYPGRLAALLDSPPTRPDYIALDIKTASSKYYLLGLGPGPAESVAESAELIKTSGIEHEFRTTVTPGIIGEDDLPAMLPLLRGVRLHYFVGFRPGTTLDPSFRDLDPYPEQILETMRRNLEAHGIPCRIRQ